MKKGLLFFSNIIMLALFLSGCSGSSYAPVSTAAWQPNIQSGQYRVNAGDTLYSIAWSAGLDYRALAQVNHLLPPYQIQPGQLLQVNLSQQIIAKAIVTKRKKYHVQKNNTVIKHWVWPAKGRIVARFSNSPVGNKGVNISGQLNEAIIAAASGCVVYSGHGVIGYGNLIIIKHNDSYLSAYAFNQRNLVKDGQWVKEGQRIATMGRNNAGQVLLHFEIRKDGLPLNPLKYL